MVFPKVKCAGFLPRENKKKHEASLKQHQTLAFSMEVLSYKRFEKAKTSGCGLRPACTFLGTISTGPIVIYITGFSCAHLRAPKGVLKPSKGAPLSLFFFLRTVFFFKKARCKREKEASKKRPSLVFLGPFQCHSHFGSKVKKSYQTCGEQRQDRKKQLGLHVFFFF